VRSKELFPDVFSRNALAYQRRLQDIMSRGEAPGRQRVIDLLDVRPGMRVLDIACGPGTLTFRLAELVAPGGEVVGVDLAQGAIELARSAGIANATFMVMDMEQLDFGVREFDAASCGHGLQFAPDLHRALSEARRVLKPGGRFAASVPAGAGDDRAWAVIEQAINRWLPPAPEAADLGGTRSTVADTAAFKRAAREAGFAFAEVQVVDERVRWSSAEQFTSQCASWWCCAIRLGGVDSGRRASFMDDATTALRREYPNGFETTARNHVLFAIA
jgi:SAM-dependent methyltransferase